MSLKLKSQLTLSLTVVILVCFGVFLFSSIIKLDKINDTKSQNYIEILEIQSIKKLNFSINQILMDIAIKEPIEEINAKNIKKVNILFKKLRQKEQSLILIANNHQERHLVLKLLNAFRELEFITKSDLIPLAKKSVNKKSFFITYTQVKNISKRMEIDLESIIGNIHKTLERTNQTKSVLVNEMKKSIVIIVLVLILFSILSSLFIFRGTNNSLKEFQIGLLDFFKFLNSETDHTKLLYESKDEIGKMAIAINQNMKNIKLNIKEDRKFIHETINILSEFEKGDLTQKVNLPVKNPSLLLLKQKLDDLY
ncbi:hypothetical protein A9Q76_08720 [Arcobacter sp. 31_11_sub10_T18]|nr:hypothetical protein A9Q76_08720 [Arcobacter sp. 31_11_sub10_T18]